MSRAERVSELIKQEISDIIIKKLHDPRIGFTSVVSVDIGADLKNANVFVSVLGPKKDQVSTIEALEHATKFIRRELGSRLQLRDVPTLCFKFDDSLERGAKVFAVLNRMEYAKKGIDVVIPEKLKTLKVIKRTAGKSLDLALQKRARHEKNNSRTKKS